MCICSSFPVKCCCVMFKKKDENRNRATHNPSSIVRDVGRWSDFVITFVHTHRRKEEEKVLR